MSGSVAKQLRRTANLKNINKARNDVTYILFGQARRIKDEPLKHYKELKQTYKETRRCLI